MSDAVGIEAVFNQCAQLQRKQDKEKFVAVVVLDEVGLAEDSPKMPLKVLHPLLEKGCELKADDADVKPGESFQKVGFVGISNWALDPAKMNRGIFVHRGNPTEGDLILTAKGIFTSDNKSFHAIDQLVEALTQSYLDIKEKEEQEFFGLRDYYGLLKMIFAVVSGKEKRLENYDIFNAIVRNFSGGKEDCIQMFLNLLPELKAIPRMSIQKLVQENLQKGSESRFLLLLTNSFSAINLLSKIANLQDFQVIFGSSFPQDNNYTEVCRNINRIKACMESGVTVVLLNLRDLYESLYDALNQHYVTFAGQRYVDLGLGGHRVKCRVSKDFKLIVIEDKNIVYNEFPIPLINRLEKYIFTTESILDGDQKAAAYRLNEWVQHFSAIDIPAHERRQFKQFTKQDAFVGYIDDSSASAVLVVQDQRNKGATDDNETYNQAQLKLLNTATMDSVFRLRSSGLKEEAAKWQDVYLNQTHDSLSQLLGQQFIGTEDQLKLFEVTSFSKILSDKDKEKLEEKLKLKKQSVTLINLQQFKTEDDYAKHVDSFFKHTLMQQPQDEVGHWVLLIQCPQADAHGNLIACAKYSIKNCIQNNLRLMREQDCLKVCVAFLYTMERQSNELVGNKLMGIHSSDYTLVHVDELRMSTDYIGPPSQFWNKSIHKVMEVSYEAFKHGDKSDALVDMEVLVKKSIPQAMLKLQSDSTAHQENLIHELASLCSSKHEVGQHFLPHMLKYMVKILEEKEISDFRRPWYVREAMSHTSLSEGGTLQKTLWLSLKNTTENILAYIISKIDSDQNLNLLLQEMESKNEQNQMRELWMNLFILQEICDFKSHDTVGKAATYKIEGSIHFAAKFPFSRRLCGIFNQSWEALVQTGVGNVAEKFMELQTKSVLNGPILDALNHKMGTVLKHYLHDMVHLYHKSDNPLEYDVIQQAFLEMCTASHDPNIVSNPVFRAFTLMKQSTSALNQFSLLVSLFPGVLDKGNVKRCQEDQANKCQLMLPVTAFRIVVTQMNTDADNLGKFKNYQKWTNSMRQLKTISSELIETCDHETRKLFKSISFTDLFLQQLVPPGLEQNIFQQYLEILAPLAKRLCRGAYMAGLQSGKFLNIVIKSLRGCTNDVRLKFLVNWENINCKSCNKAKVVDPVVLPCKHHMCFKCIQNGTNCPTCRVVIPDDFNIEPTRLSDKNESKLATFKANSTSFFLEYLSTLCFPESGNTESKTCLDKDVSKALHELVICSQNTREMSPHNAAFDESPTIRSFILQLLLRYNTQIIETELEQHFQTVNEVVKDKRELMMVYVQCCEDSLNNHVAAMHEKNPLALVDFASQQLDEIQTNFQDLAELTQLQNLGLTAKLRFLASVLVGCMYNEITEKTPSENETTLLEDACDFLNQPLLKVTAGYLVKIFCRRFGEDLFEDLSKLPLYSRLFESVIGMSEENIKKNLSFFTTAGETYIAAVQTLIHINSMDDEDDLTQLCELAEESVEKFLQVSLALVKWDPDCEETEPEVLKTSVCEYLQGKVKLDDGKGDLMINFVQDLPKDPAMNGEDSNPVLKKIHDVMVDFGLSLIASKSSLLNDLKTLMTNPGSMERMFLPTMPQSSYFDVMNIIKLQMPGYQQRAPKSYQCPNGHPYFIGDCTNPIATNIRCPDCGQPIGGEKEGILQPGNTAAEITESSQAGYKLGLPGPSVPERELSRLSVCVQRFFLHLIFYMRVNNCGDVARYVM